MSERGEYLSLIDAAIDYVYSLFRDNAGGHDAAHTLRVYQNEMLIAEQEPGCDLETVALSALLHDADDHKLFHTEDNGIFQTRIVHLAYCFGILGLDQTAVSFGIGVGYKGIERDADS